MLLHILLFDKVYTTTSWLNYAELQARLRRRFHSVETSETEFRSEPLNGAALGLRLRAEPAALRGARGALLYQYAPQLTAGSFELSTAGLTAFRDTAVSFLGREGSGATVASWGVAQTGVGLFLREMGAFWHNAIQPCLSGGGFTGLFTAMRWVDEYRQTRPQPWFGGCLGGVMRVVERLWCFWGGVLETIPVWFWGCLATLVAQTTLTGLHPI